MESSDDSEMEVDNATPLQSAPIEKLKQALIYYLNFGDKYQIFADYLEQIEDDYLAGELLVTILNEEMFELAIENNIRSYQELFNRIELWTGFSACCDQVRFALISLIRKTLNRMKSSTENLILNRRRCKLLYETIWLVYEGFDDERVEKLKWLCFKEVSDQLDEKVDELESKILENIKEMFIGRWIDGNISWEFWIDFKKTIDDNDWFEAQSLILLVENFDFIHNPSTFDILLTDNSLLYESVRDAISDFIENRKTLKRNKMAVLFLQLIIKTINIDKNEIFDYNENIEEMKENCQEFIENFVPFEEVECIDDKLFELEEMIIGWIYASEINGNWNFPYYKFNRIFNEEEEDEWISIESICILLKENVFELLANRIPNDYQIRRNLFIFFVTIPTLESEKVQNKLRELIEISLNQLRSPIIINLLIQLFEIILNAGQKLEFEHYTIGPMEIHIEIIKSAFNFTLGIFETQLFEAIFPSTNVVLLLLDLSDKSDKSINLLQNELKIRLSHLSKILNDQKFEIGFWARSILIYLRLEQIRNLSIICFERDQSYAMTINPLENELCLDWDQSVLQFIPIRSSFSVSNGCFYYEVTSLGSNRLRIGWSNRDAVDKEFSASIMKSDKISKHSVFYDFKTGNILHNYKEFLITNKSKKSKSINKNVIGCLLDLEKKIMKFYLNGEKMLIADQELISIYPKPYYATLNLGGGTYCFLNFGQVPFEFPPKGFEFQNFHEASGCIPYKYQMVGSRYKNGIFLEFPLQPPIIDDQPDLIYAGPNQIKCDQIVNQFSKEILDYQKDIPLDYSELFEFSIPQILQSLIEIESIKFEDQLYLLELFTRAAPLEDHSMIEPIYEANLFEVIQPYMKMKVNSKTKKKHQIICAILRKFIYKSKSFSIPLPDIRRYFIRLLTEVDDDWIALYCLLALKKRDIDLIMINESIMKLIEKFANQKIESKIANARNQLHLVCTSLQSIILNSINNNLIVQFQTTLDIKKRSKNVKLSKDLLSARNDYYSKYRELMRENVRSTRNSFGQNRLPGTYYYETILLTDGSMRIGWATGRIELEKQEIGEGIFSIGIDGMERIIAHDNHENVFQNEYRWKAGDVIGCLLDAKEKKFRFYLPDRIIESLGEIYFSDHPYYAAISLGLHQQVLLNFGQFSFKYAPQLERIEFWSFQSYWEKVIQHQYQKISVKLSNSELRDTLFMVNSSLTCTNINLPGLQMSRKRIIVLPSVKFVSLSNHKELALEASGTKRPRISGFTCEICTKQIENEPLFLVCCVQIISPESIENSRKYCRKCAKMLNFCPFHRKSNDSKFTCGKCNKPANALFQFECCDLKKFCKNCVGLLDSCPAEHE